MTKILIADSRAAADDWIREQNYNTKDRNEIEIITTLMDQKHLPIHPYTTELVLFIGSRTVDKYKLLDTILYAFSDDCIKVQFFK